LDPNATINNPGYYEYHSGGKRVNDLAKPGIYDFKKALMKSSNTYFIENGLKAGIASIIRLGQRLHLGEKMGLPTLQEAAGIFPNERTISSSWYDGDTGNICIGQGKMAVTPLQMAVMISAIANGGKVLWPRLVDRIEAIDPTSTAPPVVFQKGRVRDNLGVRQHSLQIVREAMLADVEEGGTGSKAFIEGLDIGGKTGTAQVMDTHNRTIADTVWFASFAPYEKPRWAVIVMIETDVNAGSGGGTCAPIAKKVYQALLERERGGTNRVERMAQAH
jgi:penicillin-binding protein 2